MMRNVKGEIYKERSFSGNELNDEEGFEGELGDQNLGRN